MSKKPTKHIVHLTDKQRSELLSLMSKGEAQVRTVKRANVLLLSDQGKSAPEIAEFVHVSQNTVYNIRKRFTREGLQSALYERPRPGAKPILKPVEQAHLIALACSSPPDDRERWTIRLLAEKVVELGIVEDISRETVRRALKKTTSSPGRRSDGVYPG